MTTLKKILALVVLILTFVTTAYSQEFYKDGSMKLTEVSTDKKYGYHANHKTSIKVGKVENEYAYIKALLGPNGENIQARRISSCCGFKSKMAALGKGFLDKWEITYTGLKSPIILYLNSYSFEAPKCPYGLTYKKFNDISKIENLPGDNIVKVMACSQIKHSVDDFFIKEKFGEKTKPTINPTFIGGIEALKKYFGANPLTDKRAAKIIFRVSIAFVVTCDGKAGNFEILSKGKGELEIYANQVLTIVNKMPQNWQPATADEKPVDCNQVLSFTVVGGQLNRVSYR